ncbi:hypothetical protein M9H77_18879 [Catharanthus roseus]|uniref:Uncharacterized protein n=1 Tax=Catharanthus roseus TaxID=4058 RepID=A0ACC0B8Q8_CATRO|nr:hypothetical protein M9H77_18879 [Catharanthus roseus]
MKAKDMGKELSIGFKDTSLSLSLNPFLLYHEFSFKELKLFLEFYVSYVTSVGNGMVNPFTCDLTFGIDHMLKCSSPCAYLMKQLLVSIIRIKPSYHDHELIHHNLFFDLLVANFSSSCASVWRQLVEYSDYESSFLYAFMKNLDKFIPSIQLLSLVNKGLQSCSPCVQLARINQGNKLQEKLAKSLKGAILLPKVALPLPSPVGFGRSSRLCNWGFEALVSLRDQENAAESPPCYRFQYDEQHDIGCFRQGERGRPKESTTATTNGRVYYGRMLPPVALPIAKCPNKYMIN